MEGCDSGVGLGGATAWANLRRLRSATQLNVGTRRVSEGLRGPIRSFMAPALKDTTSAIGQGPIPDIATQQS